MAEAEQTGNPAFLMAAHHLLGVCLEFAGDMAGSSRILDRGRELHDPEQHRAYTATFGLDPGMIARAMSSRPLWVLGYPDRAEARARETLAARTLAAPADDARLRAARHAGHAPRTAARPLRPWRLATRSSRSAASSGCPRSGMEPLVPGRGARRARPARRRDRTAHRQPRGPACDRCRPGPQRVPRACSRICCASLAARTTALRAVEEGFAHAEQYGEGGYLAELHRAKAELLRVKGDIAGAEAEFAAAVDYARRQEARSFELRAATGWAQLLIASGRCAEARAVLEPVYAWFTEGLGTADLFAARATLEQIG